MHSHDSCYKKIIQSSKEYSSWENNGIYMVKGNYDITQYIVEIPIHPPLKPWIMMEEQWQPPSGEWLHVNLYHCPSLQCIWKIQHDRGFTILQWIRIYFAHGKTNVTNYIFINPYKPQNGSFHNFIVIQLSNIF
ncbi:hypothetical protein AMTRI_Chr13g119670 [Amborella trichopoda]